VEVAAEVGRGDGGARLVALSKNPRTAPEAAELATAILRAHAGEDGGSGGARGDALPSTATLKRILHVLCKSTKRKRAMQALRLLEAGARAGVRVGAAAERAVATAVALRGEPERALVLMQGLQARGDAVGLETYTAVMRGFSADRTSCARAQVLFERMVSADGIAPDTRAMNAAATAYVTAGDVRGAEEFVDRMCAKHGLEPDVTTHNVLLYGWSRAGDLTAALERAREVLLPADCSPARPTLGTYVSLAHAYARAGDERRAARLLLVSAVRSGLRPTTASWTEAAQGAAEAGQVTATRRMLEYMEASRGGCPPPTGKTYAAIAGALARAGRVEAARDV